MFQTTNQIISCHVRHVFPTQIDRKAGDLENME